MVCEEVSLPSSEACCGPRRVLPVKVGNEVRSVHLEISSTQHNGSAKTHCADGAEGAYLLDELPHNIASQNVLCVSPETHDIICSQTLCDIDHELGPVPFARVCQRGQSLCEEVVKVRRQC